MIRGLQVYIINGIYGSVLKQRYRLAGIFIIYHHGGVTTAVATMEIDRRPPLFFFFFFFYFFYSLLSLRTHTS